MKRVRFAPNVNVLRLTKQGCISTQETLTSEADIAHRKSLFQEKRKVSKIYRHLRHLERKARRAARRKATA